MAELTIADMNRITVEVAGGVKPEDSAFQGPEADEQREIATKHIAHCRANGIGYDIPNDDENSYYSGPSDPWFAPMIYDEDGNPIEEVDDPMGSEFFDME